MLRFKVIIFLLCIVVAMHAATILCLDKIVTLPAEKTTLKSALKSLSDQTGCTFSYNPLLIPDNQVISISGVSAVTLSKALQKVLPAGIQYALQGNYILLKKNPEKISAPIKKLTKTDSNIDKDPRKVALVIPVVDESELYFNRIKQTVKDTLVYILPAEIKSISVDSGFYAKSAPKTFYKNKVDSAEVKRIKTEQFLQKNTITQFGMSTSSPLSTVFAQLGVYGFYGVFSISTDYNNSYRMGYGLGYGFEFKNNMGLNFQMERSLLFAGQSYNLGVRAVLTHIAPLATFAISRDFTLFIGPSFYLSESNYVNATTDLGKSYGVGALIGVKFNLITAILSKK